MKGVYLHDIPLSQAQSIINKALESIGKASVLGIEEIPLDEHALGRVLAEPIWAKLSSPHYHASAMDGYAVRSESTITATLANPVDLPIGSQAAYVDTGDPLPKWADAVIPIENIENSPDINQSGDLNGSPRSIRIRASVTPWSHIRTMGEDIVATQLILPSGHTLRPVDLGAIAAGGHASVQVARKPRVAILPTGTELVPIGQPVKEGDIIEYNSVVMAAQMISWGAETTRFPITPDNFEQICQCVLNAARDNDLILLNAGSSAGSEDFSARVVEKLGELLVHGIAVRPGHPVILGMVGEKPEQVPIIGVPGYPVSAILTGEIFVEPLLARWLGRLPKTPITIKAKLTRKVTSPAGDDDYMRLVVGKVGDQVLAAPLSRGAGVITSLVRADAITILPRGIQGLPAGAEIDVHLYCRPDEIENTIFVIGSHDISVDILAQYLASKNRRLTSANVGSMGGLVALRRGESHLAGTHLLDPESGEYNIKYVKEILPNQPVKVIVLVGRQQGLLLAKGNPKGIFSLEDLTRKDITYINRQNGAGTRVLLDYHLKQQNISPELINGYQHEEYTHLAVAAAVASGRADCGLGIAAAAHALDLDFIPQYQERYDLVIPERYYNDRLLEPLFTILGDPNFQNAIASLPGYNVEEMGRVIM
jgi:molybdopterin molybdotransferase/putative molybdopterin biosynthesis protein